MSSLCGLIKEQHDWSLRGQQHNDGIKSSIGAHVATNLDYKRHYINNFWPIINIWWL